MYPIVKKCMKLNEPSNIAPYYCVEGDEMQNLIFLCPKRSDISRTTNERNSYFANDHQRIKDREICQMNFISEKHYNSC